MGLIPADKLAELYGRDPRDRVLSFVASHDPRIGTLDHGVALALIYVGDEIKKLREALGEDERR